MAAKPHHISLRKPTMTLASLAWVAVLFCIATATDISGQSSASVSVDTVNGVIRTSNGPTGIWPRGRGWTIREEFRIGAPDGPEEELFSGPRTSVRLGPHGQIVVLDAVARVLRVFDGQGHFVRNIGRPGPGPGELMSALAMAWDRQNRLWIAESFNGRYSVFDSSGVFIKTVPRPLQGAAGRQYLVFDAPDSFIDEGSGLVLARVDTAGTFRDTLAPLPRWSGGDLGIPFPMPSGFDTSVLGYLPRVVWTVAPDGTIWFAQSGELRLVQRTPLGDTLRIIDTQHRNGRLDRSLERTVHREFAEVGVDPSKYELVWPMVQAIHVLDDGHVLVQIMTEPGRDGNTIDVFDPDGRFLGTLDSPIRINRLGTPALVGDTIVSVVLGDLDVPYVVRATIHR